MEVIISMRGKRLHYGCQYAYRVKCLSEYIKFWVCTKKKHQRVEVPSKQETEPSWICGFIFVYDIWQKQCYQSIRKLNKEVHHVIRQEFQTLYDQGLDLVTQISKYSNTNM